MKRGIGLIICLVILSITAVFCGTDSFEQPKDNYKELSFLKGATQERVTFHARESLDSDKKITRHGILIKRPHAKATVLICHGFMCDKYDVSFLHMLFTDYNSMAFDFRAHGEEKKGQCCTLGRDESYDVIAAAEFIKKHPELKDTPLIIYGFSMGASAAILAQARRPKLCNAMILDCPFDSTDKLLDRGISQLKLNVFGYKFTMPGTSLLKAYAYTPYVQSLLKQILKTLTNFSTEAVQVNFGPVYPEEAIKYIDIPCFFIACVNDTKSPEEAVISVYNGAKGFKRCWIDADGRRHFDTIFRHMHRYFYKVDRFIKEFLDGSYKNKVQHKIEKDRPYCVLTPTKKSDTLKTGTLKSGTLKSGVFKSSTTTKKEPQLTRSLKKA